MKPFIGILTQPLAAAVLLKHRAPGVAYVLGLAISPHEGSIPLTSGVLANRHWDVPANWLAAAPDKDLGCRFNPGRKRERQWTNTAQQFPGTGSMFPLQTVTARTEIGYVRGTYCTFLLARSD